VLAAAEVVRGDVLLLEAGDLVAADARVVGEGIAACAADTPLAERRSMVFLGTAVASGSGSALVVATGMETEVGHIAALLAIASRGETPLTRKLDQVGRRLLGASLAIVGVVFILGLLRGISPFEMFLSAVSLAVAAIQCRSTARTVSPRGA
jgi:Ca2+-transporting ATPase